MSSVDGDPFDWTVEEVIDFLCHSPQTPWLQSATKSSRPDPTSLEVSLRENDLSGEFLLDGVEKDELRNDLGLKSLGQRNSMLKAIWYLRERSVKYQNLHANNNSPLGSRHGISATPNRSNEPSPTFGNPSRGTTPQQGTPNQYSPLRTFDSMSQSRIGVGFAGLASSASGPSRLTEKENKELSKRNKNASIDPSDSEYNTIIRRGEHYVFDQNGKKRRRLQLAPSNETQPTSFKPQSTSVSADKVWYMGPNSITPDELFYPLNTDEDGESFVIASPRFPTAQSSFVNKCLKYFYRQHPVKLNGQSGNSQWALLPYRPSKGRPGYFTLYTSRDRDVVVTKESLKEWPQINETETTESGSSEDYDVYSLLARKYQSREDYNEDPILPCYGDSGSEGEYDEETLQEIDDEQSERNKQSKLLTPAEVDLIINTSITEYEKKWKEIHLPKKGWKAHRLWVNAKKKKRTNQKIQACENEIHHYENCLKKLQREICKGDYKTQSELKVQCKSMEQTVFNIQEGLWSLSVLEQQTCPPVIAAPPKPRREPKPRIVENDEESLDSESDGFIEDDDGEPQADTIDNSEEHIEPVEFPPCPSTSSDDEVIMPPGPKRRARAQNKDKATTRREKTNPKSPSAIENMPQAIDLTQDSDSPRNDVTSARRDSNSPAMEDLTIKTPPLNPVEQPNVQEPDAFYKIEGNSSVSPTPNTDTSKAAVCVPRHRRADLGPAGADSTSMTWDDIEESSNRGLLVKKSITELPVEERNSMVASIPGYNARELRTLVKMGLKAIRSDSYTIKELEDVRKNKLIMRVSTFFISWVIGARLGKKGILSSQVDNALKSMNEFPAFFSVLCSSLATCKNNDQGTSDSGTPQDPNVQRPSDTPHKKRKREVKESQNAKSSQKAAQRRAALQAQQRKALEQKMTRMGLSNDDPTRQAVSFGDPVICLNPHIGQLVKPHQLKGIQFMWRELIKDDKQQGCLLAHTMGLGKTMQVISLLDTIAAAACSADENVFRQIPEHLRRSQTLVLCPSSVVENWYEEFFFWPPPDSAMGTIRKITSENTLDERLQEVFDWDQEGGILILSYDIFRKLVENKETKARGRPLEEEAHQNVKDCLLNGPNIIVADEAHKMKNSATGIAITTKQFRSESRIALTGTPLANNLNEYFSMVDWIAPSYLGDYVTFKANYVEPIEEGLYIDSTARERKNSLIKLKVLKTILGPKIDRADITALEGSLPPKVEFVIIVPLTEVQEKAYNSYIESLCHGNGDVANTQLWTWLAFLSLCCNHPACFREKLLSRANDAAKVAKEDLDTIVGDESVAQASLPEQLIPQQQQIFDSISDMMDFKLSYRTQILDKIIKLSLQAGDKVLIFSHSIPTLNYIESLLQAAQHKYCRLDGNTPMHGRQAATKNFNTQSEHHVYLISTRAGGLGLNIPGANRVVIFDFKWNPVWEEQAVGRSYRIGQKKPVYVYRFISGGTYEEVIYNKTIFKTQLAHRVIDKKSPIRRASRSPGDYLFPVKPVKQMDVSEFIGKDPSVLDQIIKNDQGVIRRIALTETFQKEENDKLTEEDDKEYQTQLNDERLRRANPAAYDQMIRERQAQYMSASVSIQPSPGPAMQNIQFPSTVSGSAHTVGPPPLPPDTSVSITPSLRPLNAIDPPNEMPMEMSHQVDQSHFPVPNSSQTGSLQQNPPVENSDHPNPGTPIRNNGTSETPQQPRNTIFSRVVGPSQVDGSGGSGVCQQQ